MTERTERTGSLDGQAAVVTGAESGIGHSIAVALARAGCRVAVNYLGSSERADAVVAELRSLGVDAIAVRADVRVAADVAALMQQAVDRFGRLDILVNNSGCQTFKP